MFSFLKLAITLVMWSMVLSANNLCAQNLVLNYDFSQIDSCVKRDYFENSVTMDKGDYSDVFTSWFTAPEIGFPAYPGQVYSYTARHENCDAVSAVDTILKVPLCILNNSCNRMASRYFPAPAEGEGYAGLIVLDNYYSQPFHYYYYDPCCIPLPANLKHIYYSGTNIVPSQKVGLIASNAHMRRNFLETQLKQPLVSGVDYTLEFNVIRYVHTPFAIADIGGYLSQDTVMREDFIIQNLVPQVKAQDSIYNDKKNWQEWSLVKGSFIAQGGEQFLTLGNFENSNVTLDTTVNLHTILKKVFLKTPPDTNDGASVELIMNQYFFDAIYLYKSTDTLFSINLGKDTLLCAGNVIQLHANHTNTFKLDVEKTFRWSTGDIDSTITISGPGTYWVEVAYNGRWAQRDTIKVDYWQGYDPKLPVDTFLCAGQTVTLSAQEDSLVQSWQWNTGETGRAITIDQPGTYTLTAATYCGPKVFETRVTEIPPYQTGLPNDTLICRGEELRLAATEWAGAIYEWSNGDTERQTTVFEPGEISLTVHTECDTVFQEISIGQDPCEAPEIYIPNAFSPNGDGLNDRWEIGNLPQENTLHVFNRWGEVIYKAAPYKNDWDGRDREGRKIPLGIYVYRLEYYQPQGVGQGGTKQGWVKILR